MSLAETSPVEKATGNGDCDIACYRINYDIAGWEKAAEVHGHFCLPLGAAYAVNALCDEVERLRAQLELSARRAA